MNTGGTARITHASSHGGAGHSAILDLLCTGPISARRGEFHTCALHERLIAATSCCHVIASVPRR